MYIVTAKISEVATKTNYVDSTVGKNYSVAPVINGVEGEKCNAVTVYNNSYFDIPLLKPDDETIYDPSGTELATYSFFLPTVQRVTSTATESTK